jgi:hypothetical protein
MIGLDREEFFVFTTGGKEGGNGPGGRCRLPVFATASGQGWQRKVTRRRFILFSPRNNFPLQTQSYRAQANSPLPDTVDYEAIS